MEVDVRRYSISVTPKMEEELNSVRQRWYCGNTRNAMLRDLIIRGLAELEGKEEEERNHYEMVH